MTEVLSASALARKLQVERHTIDRWRRDGTLPPGRRLSGRRVVWLADDIEGWLMTRPPELSKSYAIAMR